MKVALVQMDVVLGDAAANRGKAERLMAQGIARGAELFVLPELWTTGYHFAELAALAEPEGGQTICLLQRFAREHGVEIIAGSILERRNGKVYNSAYAIGRAGQLLARYSKIHLIGLMAEDRYLCPGNERSVFEMGFGQAGVIICYDLRFPELSRALALQGCQALFIPAEWPAARGDHWRALSIARAIENQLFVIAVNRVGRDRDNTFFGHSLVVDPWGEVLIEGSATEEELLVVDIDFGSVAAVRQRIPVFADRRPDCY